MVTPRSAYHSHGAVQDGNCCGGGFVVVDLGVCDAGVVVDCVVEVTVAP